MSATDPSYNIRTLKATVARTAEIVTSASFALQAGYAISASYVPYSGSISETASFALKAKAGDAAGFDLGQWKLTVDATGSLIVSGS